MSAPDRMDESQLPSGAVCTGLTLFIIAHLFTVGVALVGRTPISSELFQRFAGSQPFAAYRQFFDMDLPYLNPLTRADTTDVDHTIEATLLMADGQTRELILPAPGIAPGERARHWRRLNQNMALYLGNPDIESILPTYLGESLIGQNDAQDVTLRLRARYLQDRAGFERGDDPLRPELLRDLYEARVWMSGDRPRLMKKEGVGESAPAAANSPTPLKQPSTPVTPSLNL